MRKNFLSDVSVKSAAFLMAYYMTNSVFQSFISLYYTDIGLSGTQIGSINALIAVVSVFTMQLWGNMGDRVRVRNHLLLMLCLCSSALMLILKIGTAFSYVLVMACAFACFYTSIQPLGDSIVLDALAEKGRPFGPVRMAGGLSFAVVSALFGYVTDALGSDIIVYVIAGMCLVIAAATFYMPRGENRVARENVKGGMLSLFKNRELLTLFALMVPLQLTYGYFYAFFSPLLRDDLGGGKLVGWAYFISATSETPFLLLSDKLFKKHGAGRLMCVSAAFMTLRWFIVATTKNPYVAMCSQLLHSFGFIVITVMTSKYVQAVVPEDKKASGQLLISVFGFGVARAVGYFGGGVLADLTSRQTVFYVCAAICLACLVIFTPIYLKRPPLNGESK